MTRRPDADETICVGARSGWRQDERYYVKEVAAFLHQSVQSVRKWARKHGLIRRLSLHAGGYEGIDYVTRYGAARVITHFRALQGEEELAGKDFHARRDKQMAATKKLHQRTRGCR